MILKGCPSFLAHVRDNSKKMPELNEIVVVRKFSKVFHKIFPGISFIREIDFSIDILSGDEPVLKALYCMEVKELQELKGQLQDLLEKGCIRPSTSLFYMQKWKRHLG
ncbi:hypothetical protein KFK09_001636 [Dendrobium nobile]|uniref:Uncharacterized protein n=1 Tax=Dendrobium nobile TaxID=94219 RepID=A0A8T3C5I7_DENNO|nr:hypothetical protein KFK09_001636 [Dendrobium nobile]